MEKHIHGGDVYHHQGCIDFSANCNPLGTPEGIKKAIIESLEHINDYPQVGCTPLKKAIAEYENTKPDQVICGNGAAEVIFSLCRAVNPRRALVPAPTFAEYQQALYSVDCQVEFFLLNGKKRFVLEENFLQALTEEIDIIFLCNPNNPTGLLVEKPLLEKILKRCQELNILMAVDECFLDFVPSPEKYTLKEYLETYDNLFLLKAFTKRYAMAGVRLGYGLCGNKGLLRKMEGVCQPWNVSSMAQSAGLAALQEREYVEKGRQVTFQELAYLKEELAAHQLQIDIFGDPLSSIWKDRPAMPDSPAFIYDIKYAGKSCEEKISAIRTELKKKGVYALFTSALDEIAWTLNLRGNDVHCNPVIVSYLLITQDEVTYFISPEKVTPEVETYLKKQQIHCYNPP